MNGSKYYKRMFRASELVLAALIGAMLSYMIQILWSSDNPFNFIAQLWILFFMAIAMIFVFFFYCGIEWFQKKIRKKK